MRSVFVIVLFALSCHLSFSQKIFHYSIKDIKSRPVDFQSFTGKRILIVFMPDLITNEFLSSLTLFQRTNNGSVQLLAIPNERTTGKDISRLQVLSSSDSASSVVFTEKMAIHSENLQQVAPIVLWLTDQKNNHSIFKNTMISGYKFLISEEGNISMVFPPSTLVNSPFLHFVVTNSLIVRANNK